MGFFDDFGNALIGAAGSVFNGIGGVIATNSANKTNREIAAATNASNERINQSQIDYNWQMWHAQNDYNNPANQRQRLIDAGLNPIYYGLDGNSAASGNAFTPIANQQASPTIPNNFDAFGDAALRFAQIRNIEADTNLKDNNAGLSKEQALTESQLRVGRISLLGEQIKVANSQSLLNGAKRDETLKSIEAMQQNMEESRQRILDLQSQMSKREFDKCLQTAQFKLDEMYKKGLLSLQEMQLAVSWFNAITDRQNASTNYYNAQTNRMVGKSQSANNYAMAHYNEYNTTYLKHKDKREQSAYTLDQVIKASDAYFGAVKSSFFYSIIPGHEFIDKQMKGSPFYMSETP